MVRCVKLEKMVRQKYDNDIFRLKAVSLLRQIEEAKEFLSHHKPSLGFWGEHLLRGFLRENLPNDVKVTQGFVTLDEDFDSIRQKLYYLIHKKEDNVERVDFDPQEKLTECGHAGFGLDYGFGGDPNAFVALAIDPKSKNIWIYDEMYTYHQTTPHIAEWLKKNGYQHANIYADSASPERTQQLLDLDIDNIQSVVKTPIEAGIDQLWQYKIHVHPKCKNIWNEFNNYVFDTDNIGNTLNRPKDENNHAIDALRYAVRQYMDMYDGSMGVDWGNQYHIAREMGLDI